jgi:hypothetical protein
MMSNFQRDFRNASDNLGGGVAAGDVDAYSKRVELELECVVMEMLRLADNEKLLHYAKGDVAEAWHAGTFNVDSVRRGADSSAYAPRDTSPVDVVVRSGGTNEAAQLKYYRSPEDTAKAISHPKYATLEQKIVPSDQLDKVRDAAARLAAKNAVNRPEVADAYSHTRDTVADRLRLDGTESRPLSERAACDIVKDIRNKGQLDRDELGLTPQQVIQWEDVLREAMTPAIRAAVLSAAIQAAPHLIAIARKALETGEIEASDFSQLARELPTTLLRSGIAGGLSATLVGAARIGAFGPGIQFIEPTMVAAAVTLAISSFTTSFQAACGQITWPVAAARISQDGLVLASAMSGAALGQALIPIPLLGAMVGNIAGAVVGRLAVDQVGGVVLGLAVETGWTVFGLVKQDHQVPAHLLKAAGWSVIDIHRFQPRQFSVRTFQPMMFHPRTINVQCLRRGVVAFGHIGYIPTR